MSGTFKDGKGTEWQLSLEIPVIMKIARHLKIKVEDITNPSRLEIADMLECIPYLCEDQLRERGIKPVDFLKKEYLPFSVFPDVFNALKEIIISSFPEMEEKLGGHKADPLDMAAALGAPADGANKTS